MNNQDLTLKERMRACHVKRWHIVRTLREQNVAEHSFVVGLIAVEIMKRSGNDPDQMGAIHAENGYAVMRWAMWHDMAEIKTGDMVTPFKRRLNELAPGVIEEVEQEFCQYIKEIKSTTPQFARLVVKLADMIESAAFISEEGHGEHAEGVAAYLAGILQQFIAAMPYMDYNTYGRAAESVALELGIQIEERK